MPERRRRQKSKIDVEIVDDAGLWPDPDDIQALIEAASAEVAVEPELNIGKVSVAFALSNDASVAALNGQFRATPKPTNVLSFPPGPGAPPEYLGDIVLALETLQREAVEQDVPFEHHLQHLVVHGLLHLSGLDHQTDDEAERMERLEIKILSRLGVANPYTGALERDKR